MDDKVKKELNIRTFEDILELVGTKGIRNYIIFIACGLGALIGPFHTLSYQFLGATPDYWCDIPELQQQNWTIDQIKNISLPFDSEENEYSKCEMYDLNYTLASKMGFDWAIDNKASLRNGQNLTTIYCTKRNFDPTVNSIVTDWDLVCDRRFWYSTTQSVIQGGVLIASLIFGFLLDKFGRRSVSLICSLLYIITGFLTPISNGIIIYIIFKVLAAFLAMGFYLGGFVLTMEFCLPAQRSVIGNFYPVPWAIGYIVTPIIAYLVRPWRYLQVALTVPSLLLLINYWVLPESPRWLILNQRYDEAYDILKNIANSNKREFPPKEIMQIHLKALNEKQDLNTKENATFKESVVTTIRQCMVFLLDSKLRTLTLVVFFCWFTVSMSYYGVSLGSQNLELDEYLYLLVGGILELPSYLLLWPAVILFGRKKTLIGFYILGGVLILLVMTLQIAMEEAPGAVLMVLSMTGKMAFTAGFHLIYVVTAELYPTHLRSIAVGVSSFWARIGSMSSPYINDILGNIDSWIPSAVFGTLSFLSGIIALKLPETSNINLPEGNNETAQISTNVNEGFELNENGKDKS